MCTCHNVFAAFKKMKLTHRAMKKIATKEGFEGKAFNGWVCKKCGIKHVKDW